jgi:hypothetical protein
MQFLTVSKQKKYPDYKDEVMAAMEETKRISHVITLSYEFRYKKKIITFMWEEHKK